MEEIYNKWQLQDLDLGNTEPYQFTKSELMDFAKYYYKKQQRELLIDFTIDLFQWEHKDTKSEEKIVDNYISRKSNNCG